MLQSRGFSSRTTPIPTFPHAQVSATALFLPASSPSIGSLHRSQLGLVPMRHPTRTFFFADAEDGPQAFGRSTTRHERVVLTWFRFF
jgi:hypothetical protein